MNTTLQTLQFSLLDMLSYSCYIAEFEITPSDHSLLVWLKDYRPSVYKSLEISDK